jgi:hypothetical protein
LRPLSIEPQSVALAPLEPLAVALTPPPRVAAQVPIEELLLQLPVERWTQNQRAVRLPFSDRPG